ncbi:MAG: hypothetical protein VR65_22070 [Desulfobulbaceae bacterium BRH_c16a]|nr:MAG: hypothetical protein VR65_22070 [Desulfobulbaceae bacterium BRH_c16a]
MKGPLTIVRDNQTLFATYNQLKANDIIYGRIRLNPGEEHLLTDLVERRIRLIPSATSQLASRSKAFQARIFSDFMLPDTLPIYDIHTLLLATSLYRRLDYTQVVLKQDRKNGGLGVHLFNSIEDLYNQVSGSISFFPFIIQPFQKEYRDIRVIVLDDYIESYERINTDNFRQNLHCGGKSTPYLLEDRYISFCREVMKRGAFPYAHLDLMITPESKCHLTEINLRGGLQGAKISGEDYRKKMDEIHMQELARWQIG